MKCQLPVEIQSISGKCGNVLYKTYKRPNGTTETRAYLLPQRKNGKYGYERSTHVTEKELKARMLFRRRKAYVDLLLNEHKCQTAKEAWQIAKTEITSDSNT